MGGNVHGADLEALDGLRRTVERNAGTLRSLTETATAGVATLTTIWDGPDAGQFRQQWMGIHRARLLAAADGLQAAADTIERNRRGQERASSADGGGAGPGGGGAPNQGGQGGEGDGTVHPDGSVDLGDPGPTGDTTGWWFWSEFHPAYTEVESRADVDATPVDSTDANDAQALVPANVHQGAVGDCYFAAAVASMASTPEGRQLLANMVHANGDGTYTVRFGDGEEVTVDSDVYVNDNGGLAYGGARDGSYNWFSVLEKAYAQRTDHSYEAIEGGWSSEAWKSLVGDGADTHQIHSPSSSDLTSALVKDMDADHPAALAVDLHDVGGYDDGSLHELSVLDVDESAGTVTLRNPWGSNGGLDWEGRFGATVGDDGLVVVPIDRLAPIVHTYESYEVSK